VSTPKSTIRLETSAGSITLRLDHEKAPATSANFLRYVEEGFYNGTVFHRVIKDFMIQGGGMTADLKEKKNHAPIANEAHNGLANKRGTLAMARTSDIHSATSQFFINHKDNAFLDHQSPAPSQYGYAVFAQVTEGMEVVDEIAGVATGNKGFHQDVPLEPVVILSATVVD
jgi:peptidyl-prolyl cis-trans isomerase B (cyclophilin B)